MTVVDLFAGVGGLAEGFSRARIGGRHAYSVALLVDSDPEACYTFKRNRPGVRYWVADLRHAMASEVRKRSGQRWVDVVIGGPPCQGMSAAGRRLLDDPRNALLKDFVRIALGLRPKVILLENVPSMFGEKHGTLGAEVEEQLKRFGYKTAAKVLQASDFGVPQVRRRAFLLAVRSTLKVEPSLPVGNGPTVTVEEAIGDLPAVSPGNGEDPATYPTPPKSEYQSARRQGSGLIFNHRGYNHSAEFVKKLSIIPEGGSNGALPKRRRFSEGYYSQAYGRLHREQPAYTITGSYHNPGSGRFIHYRDVRSITTREAARLQGFDDSFIFHGYMTTQGRHIGNAVPPILSQALAEHIAALLQASG